MKVFIAYPIPEERSAGGGGRQFLRLLRNEFRKSGNYSEKPSTSDVILFNAHHHPKEVMLLKRHLPNKKFVHRIAGVYKLYNHKDDVRQDIAFHLNAECADASIFISDWTMNSYFDYGLKSQNNNVILNAADDRFFNTDYIKRKSEKIRLVCTSWSVNKNKGIDVYKFLDDNLDFSKYEFTYIGRDPGIEFKNIKRIGPLPVDEVANSLQQHDIFVTATKYDACSNSLVEAMSCGLPAVALDSGGSPEVVQQAGLLFETAQGAADAIEKVSNNLELYKGKIHVQTPKEVAEKYLKVFEQVL